MGLLVHELLEEITAMLLSGFMEGTGIPWPGSLIMATIGMQMGGGWQAPLLLTLVFSLAYTVGALAQYAVGWFLGPVALSWLAPRHRTRLESLIGRWGVGAVCWTRPLAIGNYVSIPAGMMRMNPLLFSLGTFVGALPWAAGTLVASQLVGTRLGSVPGMLRGWMVPLVALLALGALLFWIARLLRSASTRRSLRAVLRCGDPSSSESD